MPVSSTPLPKTISGFKVSIVKYNGSVVEITSSITEISIYESIYNAFLYGELVVIDTVAMLSAFPLIGQEKVRIEWLRFKSEARKDFYVTGISDVTQINDESGTYTITLTSEKQMRNAASLFSKSYRGRGDEIIKNVYNEFINRKDLEVLVEGKTSHNVVFPYLKPLAAIDMIKKNVLAADSTPMFLYETMYSEKTKLNSLKGMMDQKPVFKLSPFKSVNTNEIGQGTLDAMKYRGQIYEFKIMSAYDTLKQLTAGAYGSFTTVVDPSTKQATRTDFDFRKHAPMLGNDWISEFFAVGASRVNDLYMTRNKYITQNSLAFNEDFPNINGVNELDKSILHSYIVRMSTINIYVFLDSTPELECGKTVEYFQGRFSANFGKGNEDMLDVVNSGKYLISAIRHYVKNTSYMMSLELVRDAIGDSASLYPNNDEPDFSAPLKVRQSIL